MTLCEYSMDYRDGHFKQKASETISREIPGIANEKIRARTVENVEKIRLGGRDFFV
jgi:2-iminoacetate synthase